MVSKNNQNLVDRIESAISHLVLKSTTSVPYDTILKLQEFQKQEINNPIIHSQLSLMLENIDYGHHNQIPLCQDTGHVNFFIQLGSKFPIISDFKEICLKVLRDYTEKAKLRPNTVDPITGKNEGHNAGENMPPIYLEIVPDSSELVISVLNKGGGSENMGSLFMLSAATGLEDLIPAIVNQMKFAGGKPCPPTILGVGIGGDAVKCMYLAKKSLLRPIGQRNLRKDLAKLEENLLEAVNSLDIGVMGLGGHSNCLDVHVELAMRHPATYPVGLIVECYCHRTQSCRIFPDGTSEEGFLDVNYHFLKKMESFEHQGGEEKND